MEEKMIQFVQWLSEKLKVTPGEAVQMLNEAPEEEVKKYTDLFLAETTQETGKFKSGGKINAAVTKFQNGGNLTRRQALDAFMANHEGVTRADARRALRSAKMSFDNNNMTGDRNQFARNVIAGRLQTPKDADIISTPTLSFSSLIKPQIPLTEQYTIPNMSPRVIERPVEDDNVDLSGISFNNMFAAARKAGVSEFGWRGNRYTTDLATTSNTTGRANNNEVAQTNQKILKETSNPILGSRLNDPYYDSYRTERVIQALKSLFGR